MLRYQLAVTVFCTECDLKPLINTLINNFSFKIILLNFLLISIYTLSDLGNSSNLIGQEP